MTTILKYCHSTNNETSPKSTTQKQQNSQSNNVSTSTTNQCQNSGGNNVTTANSTPQQTQELSITQIRYLSTTSNAQNPSLFNNQAPGMNQSPGAFSNQPFNYGCGGNSHPNQEMNPYQSHNFYSGMSPYQNNNPSPGMSPYQNPNSYPGASPYQNHNMNQPGNYTSQCLSILSGIVNILSSIVPKLMNSSGSSNNNTGSFNNGTSGNGACSNGSTGTGLSCDGSSCNGTTNSGLTCNNSSNNNSGSGSSNSGSSSGAAGSSNNGCSNTGTSTGTGLTSTGTSGVTAKSGKGVMNTSVLPQTSQTQALKSHFDKTYSQKSGLETVNDGKVDGMYNEYISCDSLVKMYRATGDKSYIDKACQLSNAYIAQGKDLDGDGYLDWKTPDIKQGMNHDHYEWRAADGIAELTNQIESDPNLKQQFGAEGQKYANFIDKDVWQKWNNKVGRCGAINKVPSEEHFIARIGKIALNMYNCTGDPKYKNWLDQNVPKLEKAVAKSGDIQGTINGGSIDNGHSADTADFISECYKSGLYFTKSDIQKLVSSAEKRGLPCGWVKLAQFDPNLYQQYMNKLNSYKYRDGANVTANLAAMTAEGVQ